jgi:type VI secretion system protein ImpA
MAALQVVDMEALLAPIAGENPAGESLRYAGVYDAIGEARRADDALPMGEWARGEVKTADWSVVIELATEALATRSKDLQIAVWLSEALVKQHGFAGLHDGLRLLQGLQEHFWDALYPEAEDGDLEFRAGPLEWLNEKLPSAIRMIPLTQSIRGEEYTFLHWEESRVVDNLGRQNQEAMEAALEEGKITGEQFDKAVAATSLAFYETLDAELAQSREAYVQLDQVLDEKFGRDAPSLLGLKKALEDCFELVESIVKKKRPLAPDPVIQQGRQPAVDGQANRAQPRGERTAPEFERGTPAYDGALSTETLPLEPLDRADALRRLAAVAAYFRRTEPHSPVAYLVQRAVRWGEMPLEAWLREVINSDDVLSHVRETLGLQETDESTAEEDST